MLASDSGHTAQVLSCPLVRGRKMRVSGQGCFFGGTSCDFKPPPVTMVREA